MNIKKEGRLMITNRCIIFVPDLDSKETVAFFWTNISGILYSKGTAFLKITEIIAQYKDIRIQLHGLKLFARLLSNNVSWRVSLIYCYTCTMLLSV